MYFLVAIFHFPDPCPIWAGTKAVYCNDTKIDGIGQYRIYISLPIWDSLYAWVWPFEKYFQTKCFWTFGHSVGPLIIVLSTDWPFSHRKKLSLDSVDYRNAASVSIAGEYLPWICRYTNISLG